MNQTFDAFVFDLDGTLLDTLDDLVYLTNSALSSVGLPTHTREAILGFVGRGPKTLLERVVPEDTPPEQFAELATRWAELHQLYDDDLTVAFPGIPETVAELRARGRKVAVFSNKYDAGVQKVVAHYLPGLFEVVHGQGEDFPRKPDPTGLLLTLEELGVSPDRAMYIGDSPVDVLAARNAGVCAAFASWGYRPLEDFAARDLVPDVVLERAEDLLAFA